MNMRVIGLDYANPGSIDVLEGCSPQRDENKEDELLIMSLSRQISVDEGEIQFREMQKTQAAVATYALKEKQARQELRLKKKDGDGNPVFPEVGDYESCSAFAVSYAVLATVTVWAVFGLLFAVYLRARSLQAAGLVL